MDDIPKKPVFVLVPGGAVNPSAYGYLFHLLQMAGYGTVSAMLPSIGARQNVSVQDDADYVRNHMILPVLDNEQRDVIIITHSYSGLPGGAAARDLGKADRIAQGKSTAVVGQIYVAAVLVKGDKGEDIISTFGGQLPSHLYLDETTNVIKSNDPRPHVFQDVDANLANAAVLSSISQTYATYTSPIPRASWDQEAYKHRLGFIRTLNDLAIPLQFQDVLLESTAQDWIIRDIETGHSPQLAQPEQLSRIILDLAKDFESK